MLVCDEHKDHKENVEVLEKYKSRCMKSPSLPDFSKEIKLSFHSHSHSAQSSTPLRDSIRDNGMYLFQTITINNNRITIFFDSGCSDFIVSTKAVRLLGPMATKFSNIEVNCGGIGKTITTSNGSYSVTLPTHDGTMVCLSGICLENITEDFPIYSLKHVEEDLIKDHPKPNQLPKLPPTIGGEVHLMIGIKYLRYHPRLVHQLSSGLSLFESPFESSDGGRGVVGGPHWIFSQADKNSQHVMSSHFNKGNTFNSDGVSLLGFQHTDPIINNITSYFTSANLTSQQRVFEQVESTGSEITFRCPTCRVCKECKHHEEYESISLKEEVEQNIIDSSVTINIEDSTTIARLPFISSPSRLANNKNKAMKVYEQQLRKLNHPSNEKDKKDVIESEAKLQELGFVDYLKNLPKDIQLSLQTNPTQHFIAWRAVWKGNSVSTPCRIVFDASQTTPSGFSLNDLLAKGRNNLNKLQEIFIRWSIHRIGIHTDIRKMYNTVKLDQADWCYQRYIWSENLDPNKIPQEKIIKTLIYGVRSSGNQAEYGLRKVAEMSSSEFPKVYEVVKDDTYVDDCMTGAPDTPSSHKLADDLEMILNKGGFQTKGVSISGQDPPEKLTDDGETIHVAGMKWFPKDDTLALNISNLNFSKKTRGKKPASSANIIPSKLTRRHCASKVAEVFDLTGRVAPITASMKMDLQELVRLKLDWDDSIPDGLRPLWEANFNMIQDLRELRFNRTIVPADAVDLNISTLDFADASKSMICSSIYARFKKKDGTFSWSTCSGKDKGCSTRDVSTTSRINSCFNECIHRRSCASIIQKLSFWITEVHRQSSLLILDHQRQKASERMGEKPCHRDPEIQHNQTMVLCGIKKHDCRSCNKEGSYTSRC